MSSFELDLGCREIANPSWDDVKSAIESLDGESRNFLRLGHLDSDGDVAKDQYMIIQKSLDGRYMIIIQDGAIGYFSLVDPNAHQDEVIVKTDGIARSFFGNRFHQLHVVLKAAKTFYDMRTRDGSFAWARGSFSP